MYTASTPKRFVAYIIDQSMNFIFYIPLIVKVSVFWLKNSHEIMIPWSWLVFTILAQIIYQVICYFLIEALPGQWLMGLKLISVYHPEMGLSVFQCMIHSIGDKLKLLMGNALYFTAFTNRERRHLINVLAETRVVQKENRDGLVKTRMGLAIVLSLFALGSTLYSNAQYFKQAHFSVHSIHIAKNFVK